MTGQERISEADLANEIIRITNNAQAFSEDVIEFLNTLVRTEKPKKFKLMCGKRIFESKISGIYALYDPHRNMLEALNNIDEEQIDLCNHSQRLTIIEEILEKTIKEIK